MTHSVSRVILKRLCVGLANGKRPRTDYKGKVALRNLKPLLLNSWLADIRSSMGGIELRFSIFGLMKDLSMFLSSCPDL